MTGSDVADSTDSVKPGCCWICDGRRAEWKHTPTGREFCFECAEATISFAIDAGAHGDADDPDLAHLREALS